MEWAGTVLYLRIRAESSGPEAGRATTRACQWPSHGHRATVTVTGRWTPSALAPEDFNESSIPQVYEPICILYQYASVCIDRYRGMYSCIQVATVTVRFFLSTKMYVLAGIRTYLVIYARICLASFGLPDSGAVKPTALRAY